MLSDNNYQSEDVFVSDTDFLNVQDIVPGGVVKDSVHGRSLGYTYPFNSLSKTKSTVIKYVIKTGKLEDNNRDGSFMVVDIGGNCGFCRSYIPSGPKSRIMFGWEIDGCIEGTKDFSFESNSWYSCEQGRKRVIFGPNKGKDYTYLKINGEIFLSFYANPESRPLRDNLIYIEATENIQIFGNNELNVNYYVDNTLYFKQSAQKGFYIKNPTNPIKATLGFVGWYTARNGGALFDFCNTKLTDNIDLFAHFTADTVNAVFRPANGEDDFNVTVGKNCLINEPDMPYFPFADYEFFFTGWKNELTGKMFDFQNDRICRDTSFVAVYKEKEYFVSYYSNGKLVKDVPFVLSNPSVLGREPDIPFIPNTVSAWEEHKVTGLTESITVNAVCSVTHPLTDTSIKLTEYNGTTVSINSDIVTEYLALKSENQTKYVRDFFEKNAHGYEDHQNISFYWNDSKNNSSYTVYFADNIDFKNPYIVTAPKNSLVNEVGIFVPGKTYYWFVYGNDSGDCSKIDSFKVYDIPVRYITAGKVTNMRDLGGWKNHGGKKVKYGLLYRGGALDEYSSYVDDNARKVFKYLGMKSEIELRGGCNQEYTAWDKNNSNVFYVDAEGYQPILSLSPERIAQYKYVIEKMAEIENYPFYFHCSAGADRTGTLAYLIYGLLDVPYTDIRQEYELTTFSWFGLRPADIFNNGFSLDLLNAEMLKEYGDGTNNLQVAVTKYITEYLGVEISAVDSIKNILLEKLSY